jgi:hypothetical protein
MEIQEPNNVVACAWGFQVSLFGHPSCAGIAITILVGETKVTTVGRLYAVVSQG